MLKSLLQMGGDLVFVLFCLLADCGLDFGRGVVGVEDVVGVRWRAGYECAHDIRIMEFLPKMRTQPLELCVAWWICKPR